MMLSIDTAVGGTHCDLLSGPGLESLLRIVQHGIITGSLSGPPCETWSAARHLEPPPDLRVRWPRPLRSSDRAWGLAVLTHRELQQLATGSALMLSNLKIELAVVLHGGAALLEHPEIPREPGLCKCLAHSTTTSDLWRRTRASTPSHPTVEIWRRRRETNTSSCHGPTTLRDHHARPDHPRAEQTHQHFGRAGRSNRAVPDSMCQGIPFWTLSCFGSDPVFRSCKANTVRRDCCS